MNGLAGTTTATWTGDRYILVFNSVVDPFLAGVHKVPHSPPLENIVVLQGLYRILIWPDTGYTASRISS